MPHNIMAYILRTPDLQENTHTHTRVRTRTYTKHFWRNIFGIHKIDEIIDVDENVWNEPIDSPQREK